MNNKNRAYIDRFVSENYKRLSNQFKAIGRNINSSCFGSMDKLNETLYALYIDPKLNKFAEKELRVAVKKVSKNEEVQDSESIN